MTVRTRFVDLDEAAPAGFVVVVDVLRAFTTVPWAFERGARRVLAVDTIDRALVLRGLLDGRVLVAGEVGGAPVDGFDLGNSPSALADIDLRDATIVHRTSAGTQGLQRTVGSRRVLAASFVNAAATVSALLDVGADEVTFVVTGASYGRDGDEDLACAQLIAARLAGADPDPTPYLARVADSDAGRLFTSGGTDWAPEQDLALACELDRFDDALLAVPAYDVQAVEVRPQ